MLKTKNTSLEPCNHTVRAPAHKTTVFTIVFHPVFLEQNKPSIYATQRNRVNLERQTV